MTDIDDLFTATPLQKLPSPSSTPVLKHSSINTGPSISGPAKYIASLFPSCVHPASPIIIEHLLRRSKLSPISSIPLAACILDVLSHKFYRSWILSLPNSLDIVYPEIILIACLSISLKFVKDCYDYQDESIESLQENLLSTFNIYLLDSTTNSTTLANEGNLKDIELRILRDINYDLWPLLSNHGIAFMTKQFKHHGIIIDYSTITY